MFSENVVCDKYFLIIFLFVYIFVLCGDYSLYMYHRNANKKFEFWIIIIFNCSNYTKNFNVIKQITNNAHIKYEFKKRQINTLIFYILLKKAIKSE
jgi:hypothetical protein